MKRQQRGFTLLEVLVALTVLALALSAVIQSAGDYTMNQIYLRDRTFAEWVARNELVRVQLSGRWPSIGQQKDEVEFASREWRWVMQVTQTAEQDLRRLDIDVFPQQAEEDEAPWATLSGFMEKPR